MGSNTGVALKGLNSSKEGVYIRLTLAKMKCFDLSCGLNPEKNNNFGVDRTGYTVHYSVYIFSLVVFALYAFVVSRALGTLSAWIYPTFHHHSSTYGVRSSPYSVPLAANGNDPSTAGEKEQIHTSYMVLSPQASPSL